MENMRKRVKKLCGGLEQCLRELQPSANGPFVGPPGVSPRPPSERLLSKGNPRDWLLNSSQSLNNLAPSANNQRGARGTTGIRPGSRGVMSQIGGGGSKC